MGDALHTHGGVTSAQEARLADAGLLAVQGPTPMDVRTGVLVGPGTTALVTGTASTAPMQVAVGPHQWVTSRGAANGPYRGSLDAVQLVSIAAAPASGTRIDVVYEKQGDATPGVPTPDATTAPLYAVVQGVVGGGKPSLSGVVGAEELATVAVSAGATRTDGGGVVITNTARQTVARGGVLPVDNRTEREALATAGGAYPGLVVQERSTGRFYGRVQPTGQAASWRYLGGGTPPTALITVNNGWNADANHRPQAYLDGSGLVHVEGWWSNVGSTTLNGTQLPLTLPAGMFPAQTKVWLLPINAPGFGHGAVVATLLTTGTLRIDALVTGPSPLPAGTGFFLDGIAPFHPATTGTEALS